MFGIEKCNDQGNKPSIGTSKSNSQGNKNKLVRVKIKKRQLEIIDFN